MSKLLDLWYAIPREREWWLDKISAVLSGCFSGCMTLIVIYVVSVMIGIGVAFIFAVNASEAVKMGWAWATTLYIMSGAFFGSLGLAIYSRWAEG